MWFALGTALEACSFIRFLPSLFIGIISPTVVPNTNIKNVRAMRSHWVRRRRRRRPLLLVCGFVDLEPISVESYTQNKWQSVSIKTLFFVFSFSYLGFVVVASPRIRIKQQINAKARITCEWRACVCVCVRAFALPSFPLKLKIPTNVLFYRMCVPVQECMAKRKNVFYNNNSTCSISELFLFFVVFLLICWHFVRRWCDAMMCVHCTLHTRQKRNKNECKSKAICTLRTIFIVSPASCEFAEKIKMREKMCTDATNGNDRWAKSRNTPTREFRFRIHFSAYQMHFFPHFAVFSCARSLPRWQFVWWPLQPLHCGIVCHIVRGLLSRTRFYMEYTIE